MEQAPGFGFTAITKNSRAWAKPESIPSSRIHTLRGSSLSSQGLLCLIFIEKILANTTAIFSTLNENLSFFFQIVISLGVDDVVQAKSIIYPLVKSRGLQHIR